MYPKVTKAKRSRGGNLSWCQATIEAFCPAINRWCERRAAKNDEREIPQEEEEQPEEPVDLDADLDDVVEEDDELEELELLLLELPPLSGSGAGFDWLPLFLLPELRA